MPNSIGGHLPSPPRNLFLDLNPARQADSKAKIDEALKEDAGEHKPSELERDSTLSTEASETPLSDASETSESMGGVEDSWFAENPDSTPAALPALMTTKRSSRLGTHKVELEPTVNIFRQEQETAMALPQEHPEHPNAFASESVASEGRPQGKPQASKASRSGDMGGSVDESWFDAGRPSDSELSFLVTRDKSAKVGMDKEEVEPAINMFRKEQATAMGLPEKHPKHPDAQLSRRISKGIKQAWSKPLEALKATPTWIKGLSQRSKTQDSEKSSGRLQPLKQRSAQMLKQSSDSMRKLGKGIQQRWSQLRSRSGQQWSQLTERVKNSLNRDPLRGVPKELRQNPEFMTSIQPYQTAVKETRQVTRAYQLERAKSLGKGLAGSAITVGIGAALGAALGGLLQTLTASQKMQVTTTEGHEESEGALPHGLPEMAIPGSGFEPLESTDPELGHALEETFSYLFPDQNPELMSHMGPESQAAVEEILDEFKAAYNTVPESERHEFLQNFASEAQSSLSALSESASNLITNTQEDWLQSEVAEQGIDSSLAKALAAVDEAPAPSETTLSTTTTVTSEHPGGLTGTQMGAVFGASLGAAGLLAFRYKNKKSTSNEGPASSPLQTKRQAMETKLQSQKELYNELVKPHLASPSATPNPEASTLSSTLEGSEAELGNSPPSTP